MLFHPIARNRCSDAELERGVLGQSGQHRQSLKIIVDVWSGSVIVLELDGASGQATVTQSVVAEVIHQPLDALSERGQVLQREEKG